MLNLKDSGLLRSNNIAVRNPATGDIIGRLPKLGADETREAIEAAEVARHGWAKRTAKDRSNILRRWYELMMENQDDQR